MCKVHAEIVYTHKERGSIHSDICPPKCHKDGLKDEEYRKFLHTCLDEWLNESEGTGVFYIKEQDYPIDF